MKSFLIILIVNLIVIFRNKNVYACTGTYIGSKVSKNGSRLIARTEDIGSAHPKSVVVYDKPFWSDNLYVDEITGFKYKMPNHFYKYYAVPDSDGNSDDGIYDEVGFNEQGLSISATVSSYCKEEINNIDPLMEKGLREADIASIVLSSCKSAREAILFLGKIIDECGACECNNIIISDKKESWYMEIVSGHQYIAIKLPEDKVAVIPNCLMIDYAPLEDNENTIYSKDLINMPKEHNLLQFKNNKFSIRRTYAGKIESYDRDRLWGGQNFLAKSKNLPYDYDFELFFDPDEKVSVKDVMNLQKYRYENTRKDTNLAINNIEGFEVRPIGIERQAECHIFEIKEDFPKEAPGILWLCLGNAEHNIYLPYFPNIKSVPKVYSNRYHNFNENQAFWIFRAQAALAELNREKYGSNVRKYWENNQDILIEEQDLKNKEFLKLYKKDKSLAEKYANDEINDIGIKFYNKAKGIYEELFTYVAREAGKKSEEKFMPSEMENNL